MRHLKWLLALLWPFCALTSPSAGQPSGPDSQAAALLGGTIEACGGLGALASLNQTVSEGTATAFVGDATLISDITIQRQGFLKSRTISRRPGYLEETVRDGNYAWSVVNGTKQAYTDRRSALRIDPVNPLTGVLRAYALGKAAAEYTGEETDGKRRFHRIALLLADEHSGRLSRGQPLDRRYELLIDGSSLLPAELRLVSDDWDSERPDLWERWFYSDYRAAEGALVPFLIEMERYGQLLLSIQLSSFRSAPVADVFGEPSGGR